MYVQRQQLLNNLNWERNLWQYGMHWRGGGGELEAQNISLEHN